MTKICNLNYFKLVWDYHDNMPPSMPFQSLTIDSVHLLFVYGKGKND